MRFRSRSLAIAASVIIAFTAAGIVEASPAYASSTTSFNVGSGPGLNAIAAGNITWFNRTASISGNLDLFSNTLCGGAWFEAFAGTKKIDIVTEAYFCFAPGGSFGPATIGDTNLVGGIDRIKITVCTATDSIGSNRVCGTSVNYHKPT